MPPNCSAVSGRSATSRFSRNCSLTPNGGCDIGPRKRTHRAGKVIALRLDRCIARGLVCAASEVLDKGPSDHHPMVLDMKVDAAFHRPTMEDSSLLAL